MTEQSQLFVAYFFGGPLHFQIRELAYSDAQLRFPVAFKPDEIPYACEEEEIAPEIKTVVYNRLVADNWPFSCCGFNGSVDAIIYLCETVPAGSWEQFIHGFTGDELCMIRDNPMHPISLIGRYTVEAIPTALFPPETQVRGAFRLGLARLYFEKAIETLGEKRWGPTSL